MEKYFIKQPMMRRVLYSLIPVFLFAGYLYGWRLLVLAAIVYPAGIIVEYLMERRLGRKVSEAVLITCSLYLLSLPPLTPWWIALVGIVFGVLFGKEVFGGFGRNTFNPAITGRLFVYITFPTHMTFDWATFGNFGMGIDALTGATPLGVLRAGGSVNWLDHLIGMRPGSMGEGPVILILIAAIYLIATKTASWEIILSTLASAALLSASLHAAGVRTAAPVLPTMLSGSIAFAAVFMATDPISAPRKKASKWVYGVIIGSVTILIRTFSLFPEGTSFGILLGNTFAPLLDEIFTIKKEAS